MLSSDKLQKDRIDTCNKCEHKRNDFKLFGLTLIKREPQCEICKCFINSKVLFELSKCPINKWEK